MDHILVIKHGALGDVIQATDAFASLRLSFPDAKISLLTSPAFGHLLSMSGWFDEIITDERKPVWNIRQSLHIRSVFKRDFDAIIDLQCSRRTARYFKVLQPKGRWFGTVKGCSDPMPDFTDVNNRDRMLAASKLLGPIFLRVILIG